MAELLARISGSRAFESSSEQVKLLMFLAKNRNAGLTSADIEIQHYKRPANHHEFNPGRTRNRISDLKDRLDQYESEAPTEKWRCFIPKPSGDGGYRLSFEVRARTGPQVFWMHHLENPADVILVSGSHLFFYNKANHTVIRYADFNDQRESDDDTFEALKALHPEAEMEGFCAWQNTYLATGDVVAYEFLSRWFHKETGTLIERVTDRDISPRDLDRKTPILIGRSQTNSLLRKVLRSRSGSHLAYRINDPKGSVTIHDITATERSRLQRFSISDDGVVSVPKNGDYVMGVVARLRNPSGRGFMTLIVCDYYAMVIGRIAEALTNEKHSNEILAAMGWSNKNELPDSFEMLFSVSITPGGLAGESLPELLCWRLHDSPRGDVS